jgi:hypothetical protein
VTHLGDVVQQKKYQVLIHLDLLFYFFYFPF